MSTLILLHSLPGAGKSFLAQQLVKGKNPKDFVILSTDNIFNTLSESFSNSTYVISEQYNHYLWNKDGLHHAHKLNQIKCQEAINRKIPLIIIDNTNLCFSECEPYMLMAWNSKYNFFFKEPDTAWKDDPVECHRRCTHHVPLETIVKMKERSETQQEILDKFYNKHIKG